ncbi:hypothetical protein PGB90_006369 [Kerria lacca]
MKIEGEKKRKKEEKINPAPLRHKTDKFVVPILPPCRFSQHVRLRNIRAQFS